RADAGHRRAGAGERRLALRGDRGRRYAAAGRIGRAAGRLCRCLRDGDRDLSHQPRIRVDRGRSPERVERLTVFGGQSILLMLAVAILGAVLCLLLQRPRQVLTTIVAVSAAEMALAI